MMEWVLMQISTRLSLCWTSGYHVELLKRLASVQSIHHNVMRATVLHKSTSWTISMLPWLVCSAGTINSVFKRDICVRVNLPQAHLGLTKAF